MKILFTWEVVRGGRCTGKLPAAMTSQKKLKKKSETMKKGEKKKHTDTHTHTHTHTHTLAAMTSGAMYPGDPHRSTSPSPNCVANSSFATDAAIFIFVFFI